MGPRSRSPGRKQPIDRVSVLFREGGKLGISFNGPVRGPAMVTAIASGSVAARMRNLKVGMVLCEVAGVSVEGVQFAESLNRLEQCARPLALCFRQASDKEVRAHEEHELREEAVRCILLAGIWTAQFPKDPSDNLVDRLLRRRATASRLRCST